MKLRNLFLASVACAGLFTACSNEMDEVIDNNGNGQEQVAAAYASFTFAMPASAATRATGDTEDGSSAENNITNVKILLFKADGSVAENKDLTRDDFTPTTGAGATYYTTKEDINITTTGDYSVHVLVNPTADFSTIANLTGYEAQLEKVERQTGAYCTDNNFLMTNANNKAQVSIAKENGKGNPARVTVNVERMAAKVVFSTTETKNEYEVDGIKITFDAYKVINTRNGSFGLRRVGDNASVTTIGGSETGMNYVIDDIFAQKTPGFNKSVFDGNYSRRHDTYVAFRKLNEKAEKQPLAYCLENTMDKGSQINGWSTGVIFRGKLNVPANKVSGTVDAQGNLYKYDGKFYATLQDLVKGTDAGWDGNNNTNGLVNDVLNIKSKTAEQTVEAYLTSINDRAKLYDFRVEFFVGGHCYYTTWLRHQNNNLDGMGVMEFAIVRNNVYQMTIKSVSKIGSFTSGTPGPVDPTKPGEGQEDVADGGKNPEIPGDVAESGEPTAPVIPVKPTDPDETTNVYLSVGIKVLPWTVRENNVEL